MTINALKKAVINLSTQERILFIQYVLDTIAADASKDGDELLSDTWKVELENRSAAYKNGEVKTRSWAEIKDRLIRSNL